MLVNDVWTRMAAKRLVVFYDPRGTGASRHLRPGAPQDMDAQVADLEAVRVKLGFDKIALVGDSYGGRISMAYDAAHPERVAKLVLSDSAAPPASGGVPTLVVTGRYDMNVAPITAWRIAHAIPGARLVVFERSGHLPSYEEPRLYGSVLEGVLDGR